MSEGKSMPMRTCVGCREKKEKKTLARIVKRPDGSVVYDETGRQNGRGAYLCRNTACLKKAQKSHSLDRALKEEIPPEVYEELEKEMTAHGQA
ncbi:MAG: YlxR family protein [Eubacteriales bacterium]|jgi:predicted RNA-binding protein YlxR (DUF448 family)